MTEVRLLSALLHLEQRARAAASEPLLGFVIVNETLSLLPYRQAALVRPDGTVAALSGVAHPEADAPFSLWLKAVAGGLAASERAAGPLGAADLPGDHSGDWSEWLPTHGFWQPLGTAGFLLLARDEPWSEPERELLDHLAGAYGHAWTALKPPAPWRQSWRRWLKPNQGRRRLQIAAAVFLALIFPVRLSILAPGETVAAEPALIRSPSDGVVERVHVQPNQQVSEGDPLFDLDARTVASRLDVAEKALATAEAEYRQTVQQAVWDPRSKSQLAIIAGRIEERRAESDYLRELRDRIHVKAPRGGIAVIDDPVAWTGRPVTTGERVLSIAAERDSEVEAWVPAGDVIDVAAGAPVKLFLNVDPLSPVPATLRYLSYEASPRPDGTAAYRLRAVITDAVKPRIGLKGTARLDGGNVPLIYWMLRKPLAIVRQYLGL